MSLSHLKYHHHHLHILRLRHLHYLHHHHHHHHHHQGHHYSGSHSSYSYLETMYLRAHDMFDFSYVMQNQDQIFLDIHSLQLDVLLLISFHFQQFYRGVSN